MNQPQLIQRPKNTVITLEETAPEVTERVKEVRKAHKKEKNPLGLALLQCQLYTNFLLSSEQFLLR